MAVPIPPPGLDGTYWDSCVVCRSGTDTGFAVVGEAAWVVACLVKLRIPLEAAVATLKVATGVDASMAPTDELQVGFRVCRACALGTPFEGAPRVIIDGEFPAVRQRRP